MATTAQSTTWLIFRIGRVACAVPALAVETIVLPPAHLTALPGADAGRPGLFRHIHETVAAIDLRYRFGLHEADHHSGRLLLGRVGSSLCGFWVDSIVGMVDSHELAPTTLPPELPHNVFTAALLYRKEIVLCSDLNRLYAMRDAGAALQRMARPEPEPEPKPAETIPATTAPHSPAQHAHTTAVPASTTHNTTPRVHTPTAPAPVHGPGTRQPTPSPTAPSPRATAARPASEHVTIPRRSERTAVTPRETTQARPTAHQTPAASVARPLRQPPPVRQAAPLGDDIEHAEPSRWQDTALLNEAPPPRETTGQGVWLIALFLLLIALGGGWYMFHTQKEQRIPVAVATPATPIAETPPPVSLQPTQAAVMAPVASAPAPITPQSEPKTLVAAQGIEVQQDREGITIIIERAKPELAPIAEPPASAVAVSTTAGPAAATIEAASEATEPAAIAPVPAPPPAETKAAAEPEPPQMYVHTVVKGDTLWDIAERYLDDPWRYKDLAQLSRIKNPDLIYPGDKIRIIIR